MLQKINYTQLVHRYAKKQVKELKWLTPIDKLQSLIVEESQEPEQLKDTFYDPNQLIILKSEKKKKNFTHYSNKDNKELALGKKAEPKAEDEEGTEERKRVYRPGPFAHFYELNEGKLDKDEVAWYYKQNKDIIGPVSSYNMDKMAYYKNVDNETRVAYKSVDKFVKFSKIKKIVEEKRKSEEDQE